MALAVLIKVTYLAEDPPAIVALPAILLAVDPLVLHQENLEAESIPAFLTGKKVLHKQILVVPALPLCLHFRLDIRSWLTGWQRTGGCHIQWQGVTHGHFLK